MGETYPMAMVTAPGVIEFRERSLPALGPHEILIRVRAASICGSDLHIFKGKHPVAMPPVAVGHELAGEVRQTGEAVSKVSAGDRVAVEPVVVCGECESCLRGEYHLCASISFQYRQGQGAFATYFVAHEDWVHPLPGGLSFEEGALVEPLSVALHALSRIEFRVGQTSAVFGDGPIGLLLLRLIGVMGGGATFVVGARESRLEKARRLGATEAIDHRAGDVVGRILQRTSERGVDAAFEAVGAPEALVQSLQVVRKGGKVVVVGLFEAQEVSIPANLFVQREITLTGAQGYCWDFQTALRLLEQRELNLRTFITHVLPLDSLQEAFELALDPEAGALKVVIKMDG